MEKRYMIIFSLDEISADTWYKKVKSKKFGEGEKDIHLILRSFCLKSKGYFFAQNTENHLKPEREINYGSTQTTIDIRCGG